MKLASLRRLQHHHPASRHLLRRVLRYQPHRGGPCFPDGDVPSGVEIGSAGIAGSAGYLADILTRIRDHDPAKLDDLLPWNWTAGLPAPAKAA